MKKIKNLFILFAFVSLFGACDLYPSWESYVEYADTYPVCGNYLVQNYDYETGDVLFEWYEMFLYNKSYNPTKDSIWIDNYTGLNGNDDYKYKFKVKAKADTINYTFDVVKSGNVIGTNINPLDSAISVTVSSSKIHILSSGIEDATPDSIYFILSFFDKYGIEETKFVIAGHRKTGWEFPEYEDPM